MFKKYVVGLQCLSLLVFSHATYAEEAEVLSGEIYHSFEDHFEHQKDREVFHIKDEKTKSTRELTFPDGKVPESFKKIVNGSKIQVKGKKLSDGQFQFQNMNFDKALLAEDTFSDKAIKGTRSVLTVIVDFMDSNSTCTEEKAVSYMYDANYSYSVKNFFDKSSKNLFGITGEVARVKLSLNVADETQCDPYGWASKANTLLNSAGYTISNYRHRMYLLPSNTKCQWAGLGNVNGPTTWVKSCNPKVMAHELGHNLGLGHSSKGTSTYGDASDTMGSSYSEFNAPHKDQLGWIALEKSTIISKPGTYRLAPLNPESESTHPQLYKILKTDTNEYYYLSYRRPTGDFDGNLSSIYANRLNITKYKGSGSSSTLFLNGLGVGEPYDLSSPEVSIKVLSLTDAYIEFSLSGEITTPTDNIAPTISLLKPLNNSRYPVNAGVVAEANASDNVGVVRVDFYVADTIKCSDTTAPYSCLFSMPESSSLKIQARAVDAAGNFKDSDMIFISNNSTGGDTVAPTVNLTSPDNGSRFDPASTVVMQASALDNIGVIKVEFFVDGSLKCSDTTAPYSCNIKMPEGSDIKLTAKAHDAAGNVKESVVVTISNKLIEPPIKKPIEKNELTSLPVYKLESRQPISCGTIAPAAPVSVGSSLQGILTLVGGLLMSFIRKIGKWIINRFKKD
jgi:hypothetical protein